MSSTANNTGKADFFIQCIVCGLPTMNLAAACDACMDPPKMAVKKDAFATSMKSILKPEVPEVVQAAEARICELKREIVSLRLAVGVLEAELHTCRTCHQR